MLFQECECCKEMKNIETENEKRCIDCGRLMCEDCDTTFGRCEECEDHHYSNMIYSCDWDD